MIMLILYLILLKRTDGFFCGPGSCSLLFAEYPCLIYRCGRQCYQRWHITWSVRRNLIETKTFDRRVSYRYSWIMLCLWSYMILLHIISARPVTLEYDSRGTNCRPRPLMKCISHEICTVCRVCFDVVISPAPDRCLWVVYPYFSLLSQCHWSNFEGYRCIDLKQNTAKQDKARAHFYEWVVYIENEPTWCFVIFDFQQTDQEYPCKNSSDAADAARCYLCTIVLRIFHPCYGNWCREWSQCSHTAVCGLVLRFWTYFPTETGIRQDLILTIVIGSTGSCHYDNLRCHQWR